MPDGQRLPDVFILGAMRAGTTFLHAALSAHPDVVSSPTKEFQAFSLRWPQGLADYDRASRPRRTGRGRRPLLIDASPYYLFHPLAPERVAATLGANFKAVILLREPGARAWSHYRLSLMRGQEHLGFLDAIAAEEARLAGEAERLAASQEAPDAPHQVFSYIARGRYAEQIERWWGLFPRKNFLLVRSQDLHARPRETIDGVFRFLALDPVPLKHDLPGNAALAAPLPAQARALLDTIFQDPNRRLVALTGITF